MNNQNKKVFLAIAAVILVAISVGALIYTYDHSAPAGSVNIQSISIVPSIDPRIGDLTVVLSNNGSTAITGVSVTSFDGNALNGAIPLVMSPILPGQSGKATYSYMPSPVAFQVGQVYSLVLKVTFANGATQLVPNVQAIVSGPVMDNVNVQSVLLIPNNLPSTGTEMVVSLSNGGLNAITGVTLTTFDGVTITPPIVLNMSPIETNQGGNATIFLNMNRAVSTGQTFPVVLEITFSDGTTQQITTQATVSSPTTTVADIQGISITPGTTSAVGTLTVTLSNGGSVAITGITVISFYNIALSPQIIMTMTPTSILPSQSGYATATLDMLTIDILGPAFSVGQTYPIELEITFANGATQFINTTATVSSGTTFSMGQSMTIQNVAISNGEVTLTAQNSGGVALSAMSVSVYLNGASQTISDPTWSSSTIAPGATAVFTGSISEVPGSSYLIVVSATTPNDGAMEVATTVVAD